MVYTELGTWVRLAYCIRTVVLIFEEFDPNDLYFAFGSFWHIRNDLEMTRIICRLPLVLCCIELRPSVCIIFLNAGHCNWYYWLTVRILLFEKKGLS